MTFRGLQFAHADWTMPDKGYADTQAAMPAGAAIEATGTLGCKFERCTIAHSGGYAIWLRARFEAQPGAGLRTLSTWAAAESNSAKRGSRPTTRSRTTRT